MTAIALFYQNPNYNQKCDGSIISVGSSSIQVIAAQG